ncbi:MAG: hypothetical protein R2750_08750 [Bacteroidales bacterium]
MQTDVLLLIMLQYVLLTSGAEISFNKVEICHIPPGQSAVPNKTVTICIAVEAVAKHLAHGDVLAACGTDHDCPPAKSGLISSIDMARGVELSSHPNPFRQSTTVSFSSPLEGEISLKLIDVTGREINELFNGTIEPDRLYEINVDGTLMKSGLNYLILRHSDGTIMTEKLIFNK